MADLWVEPYDFTVGEVVTAATLDTYVSDLLRYFRGSLASQEYVKSEVILRSLGIEREGAPTILRNIPTAGGGADTAQFYLENYSVAESLENDDAVQIIARLNDSVAGTSDIASLKFVRTAANSGKIEINVYNGGFLLGSIPLTIADTGAITLAYQLVSSLATGTAPFSVSSTTECANLNAALLSGRDWHAGLTNSGSAVSVTSGSDASVCTKTLDRQGWWLLFSLGHISYDANDNGQAFTLKIKNTGGALGYQGKSESESNNNHFLFIGAAALHESTTPSEVITLAVTKAGGAGTSTFTGHLFCLSLAPS